MPWIKSVDGSGFVYQSNEMLRQEFDNGYFLLSQSERDNLYKLYELWKSPEYYGFLKRNIHTSLGTLKASLINSINKTMTINGISGSEYWSNAYFDRKYIPDSLLLPGAILEKYPAYYIPPLTPGSEFYWFSKYFVQYILWFRGTVEKIYFTKFSDFMSDYYDLTLSRGIPLGGLWGNIRIFNNWIPVPGTSYVQPTYYLMRSYGVDYDFMFFDNNQDMAIKSFGIYGVNIDPLFIPNYDLIFAIENRGQDYYFDVTGRKIQNDRDLATIRQNNQNRLADYVSANLLLQKQIDNFPTRLSEIRSNIFQTAVNVATLLK